MNDKFESKKIEKLEEAEANFSCWADHTCNNCYHMDHSYHGGYCNLHETDTSPGKSCGDWVEE